MVDIRIPLRSLALEGNAAVQIPTFALKPHRLLAVSTYLLKILLVANLSYVFAPCLGDIRRLRCHETLD